MKSIKVFISIVEIVSHANKLKSFTIKTFQFQVRPRSIRFNSNTKHTQKNNNNQLSWRCENAWNAIHPSIFHCIANAQAIIEIEVNCCACQKRCKWTFFRVCELYVCTIVSPFSNRCLRCFFPSFWMKWTLLWAFGIRFNPKQQK